MAFRVGGEANRLNRLTAAPVLPEGWHKIAPGLWRHDNGEESRINPSSMFTNNNFASLKSADSPEGQRRGAQGSVPAPAPERRVSPPPPPPPPASASQPEGAGEPPASVRQKSSTEVKWWFIGYDDVKRGPVTAEEISRLYDSGQVQAMTYVWSGCNEGGGWLPLKDSSLQYVPAQPAEKTDLGGGGAPSPPPAPAPAPAQRAVPPPPPPRPQPTRSPAPHPPPPPPPPPPPTVSSMPTAVAPQLAASSGGIVPAAAAAEEVRAVRKLTALAAEHLDALASAFVQRAEAAGDEQWRSFALDAQQRAKGAWAAQAETLLAAYERDGHSAIAAASQAARQHASM